MAQQPAVEATLINRVSAMTLVIPIRQELTEALVLGPPPRYDPSLPKVRPVDNLRTILTAVQYLAASGEENALNQVATIHYARWVVINEGQDLLFCANFDTSFDQYLSDFMTIANRHPTKEHPEYVPWMDYVWSPCVGYPGGDIDAFIDWARSWQIPTTLFFPTISDVTVRDIAWLRKFKHLFDGFDEDVQSASWPPELWERYQRFKREVNDIDVTVVV